MKLYKDDVLEAVEREAVKRGGGASRPFMYPGADYKRFDGYMTALARYTDHVRSIDRGAYLDYETEHSFLNFLYQQSVEDEHAGTKYHKDYREGLRAVKMTLCQLKMEGRGEA